MLTGTLSLLQNGGNVSLQVGENRSVTGALLELEWVINADDGGGVFDVLREDSQRAEFRRPLKGGHPDVFNRRCSNRGALLLS